MNTETYEEIIITGDKWFEALSFAIQNAQTFICFESYIFNNDHSGIKLIELFKEAASRGVRVRILVDGIGAPSWNKSLIESLSKDNIECRIYHPPLWIYSETWLMRFQQVISIFKVIAILNKRNHRKSIIVDGHTAIIGSMNVADCHMKSISAENAWRDTAVLIKSIEIKMLIQVFEHTWNRSWHHGKRWHLRFPKPMQLSKYFLINGSIRSRFYHYHLLLRRVRNAKHRIYITNAYFVPRFRLLLEIKKAAKRGVDVQVIIPSKIDIQLLKWASITFYKGMIDYGIRIFEFGPNMIHAKTMIVDDWAIVGSSNLNHRSFIHDLELDAVLQTEKAKNNLLNIFKDDIQHSREIKKNDLGHRSWIDKMLSYFALAIRYWL
jgi:cardiolipin synthase